MFNQLLLFFYQNHIVIIILLDLFEVTLDSRVEATMLGK